ncbi:MAG: D-2-hydroxyacid dehydrogenase [Candidatus Rokuibacteriota bacterium]
MKPARRGGPRSVVVYNPDAGEAARYAGLIRAPRRAVRLHVCATPAEMDAVAAEAEILFAWKPPVPLYAKAPRLRWLQAMGAGVDWALVPELPRHVTVTRAPGIFGPWMTEYVLGWCLSITQRTETYRQAQRERRWIGEVLPDRLRGKTMVVVGLGDIGRHIARAARFFGMRVLGVSRSGRAVPEAHRVYRIANMATALAAADFVVLVAPLTDDTRGFFDEHALAALPDRAWLLNLGRGALVDEPALEAALRTRLIAGAVLDVFTEEPLRADHPLWSLPNAIITPHISGPSTPEEIAPIFNDNLARYLAGRPLRHRVDRARGY